MESDQWIVLGVESDRGESIACKLNQQISSHRCQHSRRQADQQPFDKKQSCGGTTFR